MAGFVLKSFQFRREREQSWRELDELIVKAERRGLRSLSAQELLRLPLLYRAALSSLSVARSISLDQNVVAYLESLAARAYFRVYGTRATVLGALGAFFTVYFPNAVRTARWHVLISASMMGIGVLAGWWLTLGDPEQFYAFVSDGLAQGRDPSATTEELRATLFDDASPLSEQLYLFASFLFSHNSKVAILAFALGFALGAPTVFLMVQNGLMLGAFSALFQSRGLGVEWWSWVLPHGVTELGAIVLCGAAGLLLAEAILFPGPFSRLENLARRGRIAGQIVLGAVFMLFFAALIEGIFRQTVNDLSVRYAVVAATTVWWLFYFTVVGRRRAT